MRNTGMLVHSCGVFFGSAASFPADPSVSLNHSRIGRSYSQRSKHWSAMLLALLTCLLPAGMTAEGQSTTATLTPSSGTLSSCQTFTWNNGARPAEYQL